MLSPMKSVENDLFKITHPELFPGELEDRGNEFLRKQAHAVSETKPGQQIPGVRRQTPMKLDKVVSWNLIEGFHQAKIADARLNKRCINGRDEWELRLIFSITSVVHPTKQYVAKRVYRKGDSEEIIADLEHLLGDGINKVINLAGEIIPEALITLKEMPVDIEVEHINGKDHDVPFCLVTQVRKPGVLIEQIRAAA